MSNVLHISEAASLALHATTYLAGCSGRSVTSREIARTLKVSHAHLSKVLQRLQRAGIVNSSRGPQGGFSLARSADRVTLLQVYEAIEGRLRLDRCLFDRPVCNGENCLLGSLLVKFNQEIKEHLQNTRLSALRNTYGDGSYARREKSRED